MRFLRVAPPSCRSPRDDLQPLPQGGRNAASGAAPPPPHGHRATFGRYSGGAGIGGVGVGETGIPVVDGSLPCFVRRGGAYGVAPTSPDVCASDATAVLGDTSEGGVGPVRAGFESDMARSGRGAKASRATTGNVIEELSPFACGRFRQPIGVGSTSRWPDLLRTNGARRGPPVLEWKCAERVDPGGRGAAM